MKLEEFQESGKNESAGYPTTSYLQFVEWIKSISPTSVTWEVVSEYEMDEYPEGIKDIGLEPIVRAKAMELKYAQQECITFHDNIRTTPVYDLNGNIRPRPLPPPVFPRLEFDEDDTLHVRSRSIPPSGLQAIHPDTFNAQNATGSTNIPELSTAKENKDATERQEIVDLTPEVYVLLRWKSKHEGTIYALPANKAAKYLCSVLEVGPMKARLARQTERYGRAPLATTLDEEMEECTIVILDQDWEICQTRSPCERVEVTEDTTLVRRHRPPAKWSLFHPGVFTQKHVSDWLADNAFTCGTQSNFFVMARRCDSAKELCCVSPVSRKRQKFGPESPRKRVKN